MLRTVTSIFGSVLALLAWGQSTYPVFETEGKLPVAEYRARRVKLMEQMGQGSIGVFFTNPEQVRNNDVDFLFRADSDFLYLTGFEEPDAALVLIPGGVLIDGKKVDEVLFCNVTDRMSITWLGYRMGPENVTKLLGMASAQQNTSFQATLERVATLSGATKVFTTQTPPGTGQSARMQSSFAQWRASSGAQSQDAGNALARMREIKSAEEIKLLRHAVDASVKGHIEAMKATRPDRWEYQVAAVVKFVFEMNGCEFYGYPPIVGSGPNSTILHYESNRKQMKAGEIVCMDTAGEYRGYTADVTRSFPVNGKFSPEQRAIYEIVLAATDKGIAACQVGASRNTVTQIVSRTLGDGLIRLGVIKSQNELGQYFMHGWGHGIGLDVHDPWVSGTFQPGMTFTVEPGIYIKEGSPCDKKWWNIGIRIEDNILITPNGPENMSAKAPRTIEEVERTMAQNSTLVTG